MKTIFFKYLKVITAGFDNQIKFWNLTSETTYKILSGHNKNINSMKLVDISIIISGDQDGVILAWNLETNNILFNISNSNCILYSLEIINEYIIAGLNINPFIRIYNLTSGVLINSLKNINSIVKALEQLENDEFASGLNNGIIIIWNKNFTQKYKLNGLTAVNCLKYMGNQMLASGFNGNIKIWNISNGSLIKTLTSNISSNINSFEVLSNGNLASASSSNGILIWNTNTCLKNF